MLNTSAFLCSRGAHGWCIGMWKSHGLSHCVKGNVICSSMQKILELGGHMGYNLHAEDGVKSKHIRGVFAGERPVWALSISLGSQAGMLPSKFRSAVWQSHLLIQKPVPSCLRYMTAGRNFLLKSVFQMQALPGLGGKGKENEDAQISDVRGRRSKGGSDGEN